VADAVRLPTLVTATMMTDLATKKQLAQETLAFGARLAERPKPASGPGSLPGKRPAA